MARKTDRAIAWFFAGLFILSSSILTIAIIIEAIGKDDPVDAPDSTANNTSQKESNVDNQPNRLQGTKLANFTPLDKIDDLKVEDTTPGTGEQVKAGDTITVDYTGAVANTGVIFQSSKDTGQPISFSLSGVIAGWSQGIPGMKVGGVRRLYIPANLAYGANPPTGSGIPTNADLVFDVTLHKIGQ